MLDRSLFIDDPERFIQEHRDRFLRVRGKEIEETWVAWDIERDEWFASEAVVLSIGGRRVEIVCSQLSNIAVTWNSIDLNRPPAWMGDWAVSWPGWPGFRLEWRRNALAPLMKVIGQKVRGIYVVEYLFKTKVVDDRRRPERVGHRQETWLLNGVEFHHDQGTLSIFNALDENGITDRPHEGAEFRTRPLFESATV